MLGVWSCSCNGVWLTGCGRVLKCTNEDCEVLLRLHSDSLPQCHLVTDHTRVLTNSDFSDGELNGDLYTEDQTNNLIIAKLIRRLLP